MPQVASQRGAPTYSWMVEAREYGYDTIDGVRFSRYVAPSDEKAVLRPSKHFFLGSLLLFAYYSLFVVSVFVLPWKATGMLREVVLPLYAVGGFYAPVLIALQLARRSRTAQNWTSERGFRARTVVHVFGAKRCGDEGVVFFEKAWLVFRGQRSSFRLRRSDFRSKRNASRVGPRWFEQVKLRTPKRIGSASLHLFFRGSGREIRQEMEPLLFAWETASENNNEYSVFPAIFSRIRVRNVWALLVAWLPACIVMGLGIGIGLQILDLYMPLPDHMPPVLLGVLVGLFPLLTLGLAAWAENSDAKSATRRYKQLLEDSGTAASPVE